MVSVLSGEDFVSVYKYLEYGNNRVGFFLPLSGTVRRNKAARINVNDLCLCCASLKTVYCPLCECLRLTELCPYPISFIQQTMTAALDVYSVVFFRITTQREWQDGNDKDGSLVGAFHGMMREIAQLPTRDKGDSKLDKGRTHEAACVRKEQRARRFPSHAVERQPSVCGSHNPTTATVPLMRPSNKQNKKINISNNMILLGPRPARMLVMLGAILLSVSRSTRAQTAAQSSSSSSSWNGDFDESQLVESMAASAAAHAVVSSHVGVHSTTRSDDWSTPTTPPDVVVGVTMEQPLSSSSSLVVGSESTRTTSHATAMVSDSHSHSDEQATLAKHRYTSPLVSYDELRLQSRHRRNNHNHNEHGGDQDKTRKVKYTKQSSSYDSHKKSKTKWAKQYKPKKRKSSKSKPNPKYQPKKGYATPRPTSKPTDKKNPSTPANCFESSSQAGALGTMVLAQLTYEMTAVSDCTYDALAAVLARFLTVDATLQSANGEFVAQNRQQVTQYLIYGSSSGTYQSSLPQPDSWMYWCQQRHQDNKNPLLSWELYQSTTEPSIGDDLVWAGNWHIRHPEPQTSMATAASHDSDSYKFGYLVFVQLAGVRGGYTLQGYQASQRHDNDLPQHTSRECFRPVLYGLVQVPAFGGHPQDSAGSA